MYFKFFGTDLWIQSLIFSFNPDSIGNRLKTSDSDFSDNEGNKFTIGRQVQAVQARVRQAALNLFYHVIKVKITFNKMYSVTTWISLIFSMVRNLLCFLTGQVSYRKVLCLVTII